MGKNGRKSCRRWLLPAALVLAGAAWFENFTLSSSTVEVRSAALPAAFSGLRVVQISDLHGRRFDAGSRYLLALVRLQSPDIIALTGDLMKIWEVKVDEISCKSFGLRPSELK